MSDFKDVKPYTQAELDQQAIWANEFDQWWEDEGQYQRAGGGQYERSFAWWAWLNREQKQQAIIDDLKAQLNDMEACYIGMKKERDELQGRIDEISTYATELAEYASYAEIIGAVSHNRSAIRGYCDKIFAYNRAIDIEEEKALRGVND